MVWGRGGWVAWGVVVDVMTDVVWMCGGAGRVAVRQPVMAGRGGSCGAGAKADIACLIAALGQAGFAAGAFDTGFIETHEADLIKAASDDEIETALLVAAAARLAAENRSDSPDPWEACHGFRVSGEGGLRHYVFTHGKDDHALTVAYKGAGAYLINDRAVEINGDALLIDGRKVAAFHRVVGDMHYVGLVGRTVELAAQHPFAVDAFEESGGDASAILAPMPGKVISLAVKAGDKVKAGQQLGVLEAMKMEHSLTAPAAEVVEAVPVAPGDQVDEGAVLIKFVEPEG